MSNLYDRCSWTNWLVPGWLSTKPHLIWSLKMMPPPINSARPPTTPSDAASLALGPAVRGLSSALQARGAGEQGPC